MSDWTVGTEFFEKAWPYIWFSGKLVEWPCQQDTRYSAPQPVAYPAQRRHSGIQRHSNSGILPDVPGLRPLQVPVDAGGSDAHRRRDIEVRHQVDDRLPPEAIFKERDHAQAHAHFILYMTQRFSTVSCEQVFPASRYEGL